MGHNQIAAFARLANGNVKPTRNIFGQNTLLTRSIHSFKYDPVKDEIVVPHFQAQAILTFRGGANGDEAPIRVIQGPDVKLPNLDDVGLDPVHREIFVGVGFEETEIMVFPADAKGNVAPIRVLAGPDTQLPKRPLNALNVAVDPIHDLIFVSSGGRILIFNRTDSGNVKPRGIISAPKNLVRSIGSPTVDPESGLLFALYDNEERTTRTGEDGIDYDAFDQHSDEWYLGVWSIHDRGEVAPRFTIGGGPNGLMKDPKGEVAIDKRRQDVYIADRYTNAIYVYHVPEIFR
jgi:hypothetical protein